MTRIRSKIALVMMSLAFISIASADSLTIAPLEVLAGNQEPLVKTLSEQWQLSLADARYYQQLMQMTPAGRWYQDLDPLEVLGILAPTAAERQRYAKLQAEAMYKRIEREIAFQQAYDRAFAELYPEAQPVDVSKVSRP